MAGVITASVPSWMEPFAGLSRRTFGTSVTRLRREGADAPGRGRLWKLPLEDRVPLVAACWRINLTLRQLTPLAGVVNRWRLSVSELRAAGLLDFSRAAVDSSHIRAMKGGQATGPSRWTGARPAASTI